jgi:hypothetical protein
MQHFVIGLLRIQYSLNSFEGFVRTLLGSQNTPNV